MADVKTFEELRKSIPNCRLRVRKFNNEIKDAQLDGVYKDVPCKDCRKPILDEASELQKECDRLKDHYRKDEMSPSQIAKVCCVTCSKGKFDRIRKCLYSITRFAYIIYALKKQHFMKYIIIWGKKPKCSFGIFLIVLKIMKILL